MYVRRVALQCSRNSLQILYRRRNYITALFACYFCRFFFGELTVDVCIAAIERDLHNGCLYKSIASIRSQTTRPKAVILVVSNTSSSSDEIKKELMKFMYPIRLEVYAYPNRLMQSQGRNIALAHTTSDIVSFIDADDFSHPQRVEFIVRLFSKHRKLRLLLHEFTTEAENIQSWRTQRLRYVTSKTRYTSFLCQAELQTRHQPHLDLPVHHAHVSVRREVFRNHKFDETVASYRIEDSLFVREIIAETCATRGKFSKSTLSYIQLPLSYYTARRDQCKLHTSMERRV